ncbi:MAG: hypothetical protein H6606_09740 [Flavobacteriales bacterium]|nr:hypothetical protein [Flavobacteriales bacterium]
MIRLISTIFITFLCIKGLYAEKVITVIVCGSGTGYYVQEQHTYGEGSSIHTLSCTEGENNPCKWANNPNATINFHNPIPQGITFYDEGGFVVEVNVSALNNAINGSLDGGNTSGTILVNNVSMNYSISPVSGQQSCNQIVVHLWITN